jgi:hypothetical protein
MVAGLIANVKNRSGREPRRTSSTGRAYLGWWRLLVDHGHGFLLFCHTHSVVFPHSQAPYAARLHVDFRALPICHLQIAGLENAVQHLLIHQAPPLRYSEIVREKRVTPY